MRNEGIVRREKILLSRDLEWREQNKINNLPFSELTQVEERKSGSFQPWLTLPGLLLFLPLSKHSLPFVVFSQLSHSAQMKRSDLVKQQRVAKCCCFLYSDNRGKQT